VSQPSGPTFHLNLSGVIGVNGGAVYVNCELLDLLEGKEESGVVLVGGLGVFNKLLYKIKIDK
jgi:hypothetical protein